MRPNDPVHTVKGTHLGKSAKAVKFSIKDISGVVLPKEITTWFPFSQTSKIFKDPAQIDNDTLTVSEWILDQKGLMKYLEQDEIAESQIYDDDIPF